MIIMRERSEGKGRRAVRERIKGCKGEIPPFECTSLPTDKGEKGVGVKVWGDKREMEE